MVKVVFIDFLKAFYKRDRERERESMEVVIREEMSPTTTFLI